MIKTIKNDITIRDLVNGYINKEENGVFALDGRLNIRPPFQREFVYNLEQQMQVIKTIKNELPLNIMYWNKNGKDTYELIDGQQRTLSICEYVKNNFAMDNLTFENLPEDKKNEILNYELTIYICEGKESEKLEWFKTINISGEKLNDQELLNAIYTGSWLEDAKKYFSKRECIAFKIANNYMTGTPERQDYLKTVLNWISNDNAIQYMSYNQNKENANELKIYFKNVISWIEITFIKYRKEMKGINWGFLYNEFKDKNFNSQEIEKEITNLMLDEDITKKKGIYYYVITRDEKWLNIRSFTDGQKRIIYEKQKGICNKCSKHFEINEMEGDHIVAWSEGGKTDIENLQMLCKKCNREKSNK